MVDREPRRIKRIKDAVDRVRVSGVIPTTLFSDPEFAQVFNNILTQFSKADKTTLQKAVEDQDPQAIAVSLGTTLDELQEQMSTLSSRTKTLLPETPELAEAKNLFRGVLQQDRRRSNRLRRNSPPQSS